MIDRGDIFSTEAYALGKMLDHSAWQRDEPKLPRLITPSDYDAVLSKAGAESVSFGLDNAGSVILAEFTRASTRWQSIGRGQRMFYEALLRGSGPHVAALCHHNVTPEIGKKICTRWDVLSVQLMAFDHGIVISDVFVGNETWQNFVFAWFKDSLRTRRRLLGLSAGMRWPKQMPSNVVSITKG